MRGKKKLCKLCNITKCEKSEGVWIFSECTVSLEATVSGLWTNSCKSSSGLGFSFFFEQLWDTHTLSNCLSRPIPPTACSCWGSESPCITSPLLLLNILSTSSTLWALCPPPPPLFCDLISPHKLSPAPKSPSPSCLTFLQVTVGWEIHNPFFPWFVFVWGGC